MGKRKSSSKPQAKKTAGKLATTFDCLFCNHEKSVIVDIDKKGLIGSLKCKVCGQSHQCRTDALSAPIDVFSDWVDACDAVAQQDGAGSKPQARRDDYDDDDDELEYD
ncbi:hypothetical protein BCR37DRAFT_394742 [Protomyces lactucae-debilis]|uniref:Transcription elongation factor 1 homolog n=1 Tax=Protomyces lactucae-debilis TaxID=2754530 RepID=A0A1Y2F2X2_PROLT|nr:uncharacterized protein BCR37DRAFT_394742 [Protomyces lactucae-debilis]ORY78248.1 hypothetical protein BCR37DRAFT_394742 [Protomyces lactucae-debilis]